ncbi:MAG: MAPEG family protein [Rhizomicrobium sp.]
MNLASHAYLLSASITILALVLYFYMAIRVAGARTKYNIQAPAITGHPGFERAYRVQMNTLEAFPVFLPALWLATAYFTRVGWLPAAIGLLWIVGRFIYMQSYIADPAKRGLGFGISALAQIVLLLLAAGGIVSAWGPT